MVFFISCYMSVLGFITVLMPSGLRRRPMLSLSPRIYGMEVMFLAPTLPAGLLAFVVPGFCFNERMNWHR